MNSSTKWISVSKLDAARRQVEVAIRLYFNSDDPVSLHTLTAASYNLLRDISSHLDAPRMFAKDMMFDFLTDKGKLVWKRGMNEAENFFKHADRDTEENLVFDPGMSELFLWEACTQYARITGEEPPLLKLYNYWFFLRHQTLFDLPEDQKSKIVSLVRFSENLPRENYMAEFLPLMMKRPGH